MNNNEYQHELSDENKRLKPDIHFLDTVTDTINIIEITCPYNQMTQVNNEFVNTLVQRQETKEVKYRSLKEETEALTGMKTKLFTIVVSSLGHITVKTKENLIELFGKTKAKKIAEKLSRITLEGSAAIYYGRSIQRIKELVINNENPDENSIQGENTIQAQENTRNTGSEEGNSQYTTNQVQNNNIEQDLGSREENTPNSEHDQLDDEDKNDLVKLISNSNHPDYSSEDETDTET